MIYDELIAALSEAIAGSVSADVRFTVDVSAVEGSDVFSNVTRVTGEAVDLKGGIPWVEYCCVEKGFLNFRLKENFFYEFLKGFEPPSGACGTEKPDRIWGYIQLAENEKTLAGAVSYPMPIDQSVRKAIMYLAKAQSLASVGNKNAELSYDRAIRIIDKIRTSCVNLKKFVITYEPLLIAARGSLANLN